MIILDLDNCISDDDWRIQTIDWEEPDPELKYELYHSLAFADDACCIEFQGRDDIVVFTARPNRYRRATENWLKEANIQPKHVMMRPSGNTWASADLKLAMLRVCVMRGVFALHEVEAAYDDHPEVLEAYKTAGLNAIERRLHDIPYRKREPQ